MPQPRASLRAAEHRQTLRREPVGTLQLALAHRRLGQGQHRVGSADRTRLLPVNGNRLVHIGFGHLELSPMQGDIGERGEPQSGAGIVLDPPPENEGLLDEGLGLVAASALIRDEGEVAENGGDRSGRAGTAGKSERLLDNA